tara:strand:+ start:29 stop:223 length:195 start_codon:yes stop_codon:yes gene_type:complete
MKKYERIILYTATETYYVDPKSPGALGVTALDYIIPALENSEVTILDYDSEDYKLVKMRKVSDG